MSRIDKAQSASIKQIAPTPQPQNVRSKEQKVEIGVSPRARRATTPPPVRTPKSQAKIDTREIAKTKAHNKKRENENSDYILQDIKRKGEAQKPHPPLTQKEKDAIARYTWAAFDAPAFRTYITAKKRGGQQLANASLKNYGRQNQIKKCQAESQNLYRGISKLPDYKGVVFHGFTPAEKDLAKIQKGDVVMNAGFLSTSVSKKFASDYTVVEEGEASLSEIGDCAALLVITSSTGKNIAALAEEGCDAAEILFCPNTTFEVQKKLHNPEEDIMLVYVKERNFPSVPASTPAPMPNDVKDFFTGKKLDVFFMQELFKENP